MDATEAEIESTSDTPVETVSTTSSVISDGSVMVIVVSYSTAKRRRPAPAVTVSMVQLTYVASMDKSKATSDSMESHTIISSSSVSSLSKVIPRTTTISNGAGVGDAVGAAVGDAVGATVGDAVGAAVDAVGATVGCAVGAAVGDTVGNVVGDSVGVAVGFSVTMNSPSEP